MPRCMQRIEAHRAKRTAAVADSAQGRLRDAGAAAGLHHRHPGRRPARAHAGARRRRGSASSATSITTRRVRPAMWRPPRRSAPSTIAAKLAGFAAAVDVVTYEFENVPVAAAAAVARIRPVRPGLQGAARSRRTGSTEKRFVSGLGLPVAPFAAIAGPQDFDAALGARGAARDPEDAPARLRRQGAGARRDGRRVAGGVRGDRRARPRRSRPWSTFACEVSVLLVRGADGETRFYDIPVNRHEGGILRTSTVPCELPAAHQARARAIAADAR